MERDEQHLWMVFIRRWHTHHFLKCNFSPAAAATTEMSCWETFCRVLLRQQHQKTGGWGLGAARQSISRRGRLVLCRTNRRKKICICLIKEKSCLLEKRKEKKKWIHVSLLFFFRVSELLCLLNLQVMETCLTERRQGADFFFWLKKNAKTKTTKPASAAAQTLDTL